MRALTLIHRWLGVAFCLLFAMWFGTGIVMHFVPFPALTEAERVAGLAPLHGTAIVNGPEAALRASGVTDADRVRLFERADGLVYIVSSAARLVAVRVPDLSSAAVRTPDLASAIATDHAHRRGLEAGRANVVELSDYDQWTVPNALDAHRPLYRVALNDAAGTELYVSSMTGEVVRDTTARERLWNYAGSVVHWIYPTALRRHWGAWDATVWWLSLAACIAAATGAVLGFTRMRWRRLRTPYKQWHAWHHVMGIACGVFVMTWIVSGWLSMDHGRLFSTGRLPGNAVPHDLLATALTSTTLNDVDAAARELEWFVFGGRAYRRDRIDVSVQHLRTFPRRSGASGAFLEPEAATAFVRKLAGTCASAAIVDEHDAHRIVSSMPAAPVYRVVCGDTWYHVDGANGAMLETLDPSRRAYRWLYAASHTLDFPALAQRPGLRTLLIVALCSAGFAFSVTAVVIGWRRLMGHAARAKHAVR